MKYRIFSFIALILVGGGGFAWHSSKTLPVTYERESTMDDSESMVMDSVSETIPFVRQSPTKVKEIEIQPGDTFSTIMEEIDVPSSEQTSILTAVQDVYDFTKLRLVN